jgi:hypothetical protein
LVASEMTLGCDLPHGRNTSVNVSLYLKFSLANNCCR